MAESKHLVEDFLNYRLLKMSRWLNHCQSRYELMRTMDKACQEFERRYTKKFSKLSDQIPLSANISTAELRSLFFNVNDELFHDGIRWGRIVALFSFASSFGTSLSNYMGVIRSKAVICCLTNEYLQREILEWVENNGGWATFLTLFSKSGIYNENWRLKFNWLNRLAGFTVGILMISLLYKKEILQF
ncbi:hypothetical protein GJ496_001304 [Pomphorhynchus laevis]|nr:hypothetical protein GJ496_001304 [Pomphorhynchus laevis]